MSESRPFSAPEWVDPDDAPEWTAETFDRAVYSPGRANLREGGLPAVDVIRLARSVPASITGVYAMAKKTTGAKAAKAASKTLSDGRTSKASKTAAGSALSEVEKGKKK